MKNPRTIKVSLIAVALLVMLALIVGLSYWNRHRLQIQSTEEPFVSLKQPFRSVHGAHVLDGGIGSVAVRIVDATGREEILVAIRDIRSGTRSIVVRDAYVEWDNDYGFCNIMTPEKVEDISYTTIRLSDTSTAISDLANILRMYRNQKNELAYAALIGDDPSIYKRVEAYFHHLF